MLLVRQVTAVTCLAVDHYVSVDFQGFAGMVDALGGVQVCLSQDANDPGAPDEGTGGSGFHAIKGVHLLLHGVQALQYVGSGTGCRTGT